MIPDFSRLSFRRRLLAIIVSVVAVGSAGVYAMAGASKDGQDASRGNVKPVTTARAVLTVALATPQIVEWPRLIVANGNIAPWQEAVIGAEISGYRLTDVLVNVGAEVKKGELLAKIDSDMLSVELEQAKAMLMEAEAMLSEAHLNADRARKIETAGAMSAQQINQYLTAEQTALARVSAAKAKLKFDQLRLAKTRIVAPEDGLISARTAAVGSLTQPGQELFHIIRSNRLEWRAEVSSVDLNRIKPGMTAWLTAPNGKRLQGKVRTVAPTVDTQTRNAIVYIDLPNDAAARAGMFARGEFELGATPALTLPQSAVLLRDGFSYVYRVDNNNQVVQLKVTLGRRVGDRIEITSGLEAKTRVVVSGAGFLVDGDVVRVVANK